MSMCCLNPSCYVRRLYPPAIFFPLHAHHWHQFIYAISGTLVVTVENTWYVISPEQAIWVPKGQLHTTGALSAAQFRSLCITPVPELAMPEQYTLYSVSPLLRELIIELQRIRRATEAPVYVQQLHGLISSAATAAVGARFSSAMAA